MATRNGGAPSKEGQKLVRGQYSERVVAGLGAQRLIADHFLKEFGVFDPQNITIWDLRRMRMDPMIKMGLYYAKAPLIRADWQIKCEDPAIKEAMTEIVRKVRQSWMRTALVKLDYGFQAACKNYELGKIDATYEDPETGEIKAAWPDEDIKPVMLATPIPIPPEHAKVHLKDGRFIGIDTTLADTIASHSGKDEPQIPVEWALWFTNEFEEQHRNYYGISRIAPAYEPWYAYWHAHHMRSRHLEMDADPALQVWYPPGSSIPDPTDINPDTNQPRRRSNRDSALEIGASLRGGATIVWPSDVFTDEQGKSTTIALWRAEFLKGGENLSAFNEVLDDLEIQKLRATLVPEEALVASKMGQNSRASAGTYGQIFTESLEIEAQDLDDVWNRHQLRAIVEANWGADAPTCEIETTGFQDEDLSLYHELLQIAFNADPNALPIKFEDIMDKLDVPQYTAQEQKEREEAIAEAQAEAAEEEAAAAAEAGAPPGEVGALPGEAPAQLAASQDARRTRPKKYERERIHLSSTAPGWAKREGKRRDRNVKAVAERLQDVMERRYENAFEAAADAVVEADMELSLGVAGAVGSLLARIKDKIMDRLRTPAWSRELQGEMAGAYHAAGAAELIRMGLSADSWDVGRDEVQEWARWRAGELIKTIDETVVEKHIRPWLTKELQNLGIQDGQGIPYGTMELAQQLTDKFNAYPQWMAERVVRTEARLGYNESAADMWERVGVTEVDEYDGLGGRTGKTDADCLARNGRRVSIAEFREDNRREHPNGTLGGVPVLTSIDLKPLQPAQPSMEPQEIAMSLSVYAITDTGEILGEEATGRLMAGQDAT